MQISHLPKIVECKNKQTSDRATEQTNSSWKWNCARCALAYLCGFDAYTFMALRQAIISIRFSFYGFLHSSVFQVPTMLGAHTFSQCVYPYFPYAVVTPEPHISLPKYISLGTIFRCFSLFLGASATQVADVIPFSQRENEAESEIRNTVSCAVCRV